MFEIQKGVPMPFPEMERGAGSSIYPFKQMADGECFFVPVQEGETLTQVSSRVRSAAIKWNQWGSEQKPPRRFPIRTISQEKRVGVWCVFQKENV